MKTSMILGAAAALLLAGAAQAQQPVRRGADADGDRRVSLAEMQVKAAERFARMDANRDGRLTREERQAARQQMRAERQQRRGERQGQRFARRDTDRDGFLNPAEAGPRLGQHFAHLDADRDSRLSPAELQAGRAMLRAQRPEGRAGAAAHGRADANGDGVITRAELDAQVFARFTRLDVNRDGFLTREERRAGRGPRRAG